MVQLVDWQAQPSPMKKYKNLPGTVQRQKISLRKMKQNGATMVLCKISRNTKIPGIGSAKTEKKSKNVLLQKQRTTPYDEEHIFLKNSMQISGLYIILASAIW